MSAPNLRERVRFDLQSQAVDGAGNIVTTWTAVATVWAAPTRKAAREAWVAGRPEGMRTFEFVTRWRSDIGTNHRIFWRGRRFDVNGVENEDGQRQFMTIFATERDADGDSGDPFTAGADYLATESGAIITDEAGNPIRLG